VGDKKKENQKKIKVTWLGYQERLDGSQVILVNEVDSRTTVVYDKDKHGIIA
jgi:hypothetical protein